MNKYQKVRIIIFVVCAALLIIATYAWGLPWWFPVLFLSLGPLSIIGDKIYGRVRKKPKFKWNPLGLKLASGKRKKRGR